MIEVPIHELPRNKKRALAKAFYDLNYSASEIAKVLGIHRSSVYRYSDKPLAKDLRQFATEIQTFTILKHELILAKLLKQIEDSISHSQSLRELIPAYDILKKNTPSLADLYQSFAYKSSDDDCIDPFLFRQEQKSD